LTAEMQLKKNDLGLWGNLFNLQLSMHSMNTKVN